MNPKYKYLYIGSSLLLLFGAAMGLMRLLIFDLVYLIGGLGYMLYFLLAPKGMQLELRTSRLVKMNLWASLLFVISAGARMGLLDRYGAGLWILFLALGLVFMLYANLVGLYSSSSNSRPAKSRRKHGKKNK